MTLIYFVKTLIETDFILMLEISLKNGFPSPDGSGILFIFSLKIKRYSGQQVSAP
ncbi:hypothetical protein ACQ9BO_21995 [Flavobacterium sp. P21]|uniref:hypothetical protein n=1 Tax=Flavobacterium sp. P21 TaxID=3423948 RepID=UPI003D6752A6